MALQGQGAGGDGAGLLNIECCSQNRKSHGD